MHWDFGAAAVFRDGSIYSHFPHNYCVFLDFVHHPVLKKLENNISETGSVSVLT
jgi:hypothetical protein